MSVLIGCFVKAISINSTILRLKRSFSLGCCFFEGSKLLPQSSCHSRCGHFHWIPCGCTRGCAHYSSRTSVGSRGNTRESGRGDHRVLPRTLLQSSQPAGWKGILGKLLKNIEEGLKTDWPIRTISSGNGYSESSGIAPNSAAWVKVSFTWKRMVMMTMLMAGMIMMGITLMMVRTNWRPARARFSTMLLEAG